MRHFLSGMILSTLLVLPAAAGTLKLKDGTTIECKVRSYDAATQTLNITTADGKDTSYTMAQLDGRSVYLVNASLIPEKDAKAQLLAANFARDAGLYAHAARRYGLALKLDPSLKSVIDPEMTKLKRAAAASCMDRARAAVGKGDYPEAERWLKVLIEKLPNEPEAAQATAMLDQYYAKNRAAKIEKADQKASTALQKDIAEGKKRYDLMVDKTKKGLESKSDSQAESLFEAAVADGMAVLKQIDALEKKATDSATKEQAQGYRTAVTEQVVEVHLHIASLEATKSDYKGAQRAVNQALALDPKNASALSMRARIEEYSSQGRGWRWD